LLFPYLISSHLINNKPKTLFSLEMIDFTLSPSQTAVRDLASSFSNNVLKSAAASYEQHPTQKERFQSLRPFYRKAVEAGLVKALVPE
jgi:alkylation response protein AidB-like acyl-CoA dehydrogenase